MGLLRRSAPRVTFVAPSTGKEQEDALEAMASSSVDSGSLDSPAAPETPAAAADGGLLPAKPRYWPTEAEVLAVLGLLSAQDRRDCDAVMANRWVLTGLAPVADTAVLALATPRDCCPQRCCSVVCRYRRCSASRPVGSPATVPPWAAATRPPVANSTLRHSTAAAGTCGPRAATSGMRPSASPTRWPGGARSSQSGWCAQPAAPTARVTTCRWWATTCRAGERWLQTAVDP